MLSNKTYDFLKWFAAFGLHALGCLYVTLASQWGLPYADSISKTLDAVGLCLGAFLMWENYDYNKKNGIAAQTPDDEINEDAKEQINGI